MGREAELKALFTLKNNPDNKKVLDNAKGDIERALSSFSMKGGSKGVISDKMLKLMSPADRAFFEKRGKDAGLGFMKGLREVTGRDLAKVFGMGGFNASGNSIKGLRDVIGRDLAKVHAMGEFGAYDGPKPPKLKKTDSVFLKSVLQGLGIGSGIEIFRTVARLFKSAVDKFLGTIDAGFKLYTSAAAQGINTRFAASRSAVSGMLGVSGDSNEVFKFGAAMQELTKRTTFATDILSKNSRALFNTSVNFKMLRLDMDALWSTIATKLAPAINLVTFAIDGLVRVLTVGGNAIANAAIAAYKSSHPIAGALLTAAGKVSGLSQLPPVVAGMKQLPASAWEHMGLVIGGGGNSAATQTAHNTGKMVKILGGIAASLGTPNKNFGLNPTLNTP